MKETATLGKNIASLSATKTDKHALGRPLSTDRERTKALGMQPRTCTRVQPMDAHAPCALTPLCALSGGVQSSYYSMRTSCYSMSPTATWRGGARHGPCLSACSLAVARTTEGTRRRTVTQRHSERETAPMVCVERARCDDVTHSRSGGRRKVRRSRSGWPLRLARAASPKHQMRKARERGFAHRTKRSLWSASSHPTRLMRRCRLLPRNQVHQDSSSKAPRNAEEPPLPASRAARGAEESNGFALAPETAPEVPLGASSATARQFGQSRPCRPGQHQHQHQAAPARPR